MKFAPKATVLTPFPLLRLWAKSFDVSISDELKHQFNSHLSYNRYAFLPDAVVITHLQGKFADDYLTALSSAVLGSLRGAQDTFIDATFEGLTADESEQIIWSDIYSAELAKALHFIHNQTTGLPPLLALLAGDNKNNALKITVAHLKKTPAWSEFTSQLEKKEDKDKISRWTNAGELPTRTKILSLIHSSSLSGNEKKYFATSLIHARFIDSLKRDELTNSTFKAVRTRLLGLDFKSYSLEHREKICRQQSEYFAALSIDNERMNNAEKVRDMSQYQRELKALQRRYGSEPRGWGFKVHFDWLVARLALQQGEVKRACRLYTNTLDYVVSMPPDNMKRLLDEALMCASISGKSGDSVLLKKAKNLSIIFGFSPPHDYPDEWPSVPHKEVCDFVKPYEVEELQRELMNFLPSAKIDFSKVPSPFIVACVKDVKLSSPNRKSRIGASDTKLEQITQAVQRRNYSEFESMLNEARLANIGNHSRGHSALIIALQNFKDTSTSDDRKVVYLLLDKLAKEAQSKNVEIQKQINTRTNKRKLTALSLALDCYDTEVVSSLLKLGADANQRCSPEFKTPLLHAMRRVADCLGSSAHQHKLQRARDNIYSLLEAGAKPGLTHDRLGLVGSGYTVAMLAAELDELELLKAFEENSDDSVLKAVYLDPFEAKLVGLGHIATYNKSKKVIDFLRSSPSFADGPDRFTEGIKV